MRQFSPPSKYQSVTVKYFPKWESVLQSCIGLPYGEGAAGPCSFHCAGLVSWWFNQFGFNVPNPAGQTEDEILVEKGIAFSFYRVKEPDFGDVAKIVVPGQASHLGIILFDGILQSTREFGVTVIGHGRQPVQKLFRHKDAVK